MTTELTTTPSEQHEPGDRRDHARVLLDQPGGLAGQRAIVGERVGRRDQHGVAEQQHDAGDPVPAVPDREAVEAGEPVEHGQAREQEQLDQHQVGAEQAAQPGDLGQHAGGALAVARAGGARPERDDDPRVRQREQGEEPAGDPPPRRAHPWSVVTGTTTVNRALYGCGMDGPELTAVPAITLVRLIMERAVSAVEVVETYLRRIDAVGATVNAVVQVDGERALAAARAADARLGERRAGTGCSHGVPFTAKDNLEAAGAPDGDRRARAARASCPAATRPRSPACGRPGRSSSARRTARRSAAASRPTTRSTGARATRTTSRARRAGAAAARRPRSPPAARRSASGPTRARACRLPAHFCGLAALKPHRRARAGDAARSTTRAQLGAPRGPAHAGRAARPLGRRRRPRAARPRRAGRPRRRHRPARRRRPGRGRRCRASASRSGATTGRRRRPRRRPRRSRTPPRRCARPGARVAGGADPAGRSRAHARRVALLDVERRDERSRSRAPRALRDPPPLGRVPRRHGGVRRDARPRRSAPCSRRPRRSTAPSRSAGEVDPTGYTTPFSLAGWPAATVRAGTSPEGLPIGVQLAAPPWRDDVALAAAAAVERALGGFSPPRAAPAGSH